MPFSKSEPNINHHPDLTKPNTSASMFSQLQGKLVGRWQMVQNMCELNTI